MANKRNAGFTLVELIVVIVILAILAGVGHIVTVGKGAFQLGGGKVVDEHGGGGVEGGGFLTCQLVKSQMVAVFRGGVGNHRQRCENNRARHQKAEQGGGQNQKAFFHGGSFSHNIICMPM